MKSFSIVGALVCASFLVGCCHNRPFFGTNPYSYNQTQQYYAQPVQPAPPPVQYVQQPQVQYVQPQQVCPQVCPTVCTPCY